MSIQHKYEINKRKINIIISLVVVTFKHSEHLIKFHLFSSIALALHIVFKIVHCSSVPWVNAFNLLFYQYNLSREKNSFRNFICLPNVFIKPPTASFLDDKLRCWRLKFSLELTTWTNFQFQFVNSLKIKSVYFNIFRHSVIIYDIIINVNVTANKLLKWYTNM